MDRSAGIMQLVFFLAPLAALSSLTAAIYQCLSNNDCACGRGIGNSQELVCPWPSAESPDPTLKLQVWPEKAATLSCQDSHVVHYEWLGKNIVGQVEKFTLFGCPVPSVPLGEFMVTLGVNPTTLNLQSISGKTSLSRQSFEGLDRIQELSIEGFSNLSLSDGTFINMKDLTQLDIRNSVVNMSKNVFQNLTNLKRLELTNLNLTHLEPEIFQSLTNLKMLNLWGNKLHNLTRQLFSKFSNLQSLGLNTNELAYLPGDVFTDLVKLQNISLYGNNFTSLPQGLFTANQALLQVKLNSNRKTLASLPGRLFANLSSLREVDLKDCNISTLPEDLMWDSTNISTLQLSKNSIKNLPPLIFKDGKNLTELYLNSNKLTSLPDNVFSSLEKLQRLYLDHNQLTTLNETMLQGLVNLKILTLNNNALSYIDSDTFRSTQSLTELDMSDNHISFLKREDTFGNWSPLLHCVEIQVLRLVNNSITEIYADWRNTLTKLFILDLRHNSISHLETRELHFLSNNLTVDLRHNRIESIQMIYAEALSSSGSDINNRNVTIKLDDNPVKCDCNIYYLLKYLHNRLSPKVNQLMELHADNLTCAGPPEKEGMRVTALGSRTFTCKSPRIECPEQCSCSYRPEDRAVIVDCSGARLRNVPASLPAAQSVELIMDNNFVESLPTTLQKGYSKVSKLSLSHNNLTWLNNESLPSSLKELHLDHNNLTRLNSSLFGIWTNRTNLTLHGNPWICDCETMDFFNFLQTSFKQVDYLNNVTCSDGRSLARLTTKDICPLLNSMVVALSVVIAIIGISVGLLAAAYFRYQAEVKIWLYAHSMCLWFVTEEELDKDKIYDAFVSYSHKDEDFVTNKLLPGLETGPIKFKLCVHYRDWIAGEFISTQITRSVQESRRTLVVLSPDFVKSEWGRLEFRAAHKQALSEGRTRVIVVIYGDLSTFINLDSELQAYLTTNTYVKWGDPWFWDKLRYALPHPPKKWKGMSLTRKESRSDKIELVNPSTPPAVTTPPTDMIINPLELRNNGYINHGCDILLKENENLNGSLKCV